MPQLAWQTSAIAWLILVGAAIAALHAMISYSRAGHVASAGWLRLLLGLRLVAISTIAVAAFQPSLFIKRQTPTLPKLVLMIDSSRSMGVVDSASSTSDLLSLAESVGQIDRSKRVRPVRILLERLHALPEMLRQQQSLRLESDQAKTAGKIDDKITQRVQSQLEQLTSELSAITTLAQADPSTSFAENRLKQISEALQSNQTANPQRLIETLQTELRRRDAQADEQLAATDSEVRKLLEQMRTASRIDLAKKVATDLFRSVEGHSMPVLQTLTDELRPDSLVDLSADQSQSPLLQALRRMIERADARDLQAIVLLSDGRSTEPRTALPPLLSAAGVPVYPVLCAPSDRQADVRIVAIDTPPTALAGETIAANVRLRSRGADGKTVKVTVTDGKTEWSKPVTLTGDSNAVAFDIPAGALPMLQIKATVEPIKGETSLDNNVAQQQVTVVDQKISVMLIATSAAWDVQYLRNILKRTPWVTLQEQFLQPRETCRFSVDAILQQDVIVLAGATAEVLSPQQIDAIHRAASEQSKAVMLMGVDPQTLKQYSAQPLLAAILPYRIDQTPAWRSSPTDEPTLRPVPTTAANALPMLKLDDQPDASTRKWLARALMYRVIELGQLKPQAKPVLMDRTTETPLMIESVVGSGRSMLMLIDETWRWRRDEGGDAHDQFWLRLIRHLAEPRYNVTKDDLSLGVDRTRAIAGQTIDLRARTGASITGPVNFILKQGEQILETLPASTLLPDSGRWSGRLTPQMAGDLDVILQAGGREISLRIHVAPADESETADISPDPALLRRIANATGGKMFMLRDLSDLKQLLASPPANRDDTIAYAVWCSPYLFGILIACLGLEWAFRKQIGLV